MLPSNPQAWDTGLAVRDLRAVHDGRTRLEDLRFHIPPGQRVCLHGPPGCGKSLLLRLLAGLELPAFGRVTWEGRPVAGQDLDRGLVLWDSGLFPWLSLLENCVLAGEAAWPDLAAGEVRARAVAALVLAGLGNILDERPLGRSPGERLRANLARSLVLGSPVLFLDDPCGALEPGERAVFEAVLPGLLASASPPRTVVLATADLDEALCLAERVIGLPPGPGPLVCDEPTPGPRPVSRDELYGAPPFQELRRAIGDRYRQDRRRRLAARDFFGFGEGI
ncbi:MAG: ATP-binding cassette domain-containing protein [Solidesulfovibrio sp. DCME]|uniref:ATP-binding cassette domain-containing protein n=1 Tax=Solidesulfovibrio sp. DCME TaxID=3447380 RepID=UPI003D0E71A2